MPIDSNSIPLPPINTKNLQKIFSAITVKQDSGCWEWVCAKTRTGRGYLRLDGRTHLAYIVLLRWFGGGFRNRSDTDQWCDNLSCVNPTHWLSPKLTLFRRFFGHILPTPHPTLPTPCWQWTGTFNKSTGYGILSQSGQTQYCHQISYREFVKEIPDGLEIDHLCRNRACCSPIHLEAVPPAINNLRGEGNAAKNARKTHCKTGHLLSGDNLFIDNQGHRQCRACSRRRTRECASRRTSRLNATSTDS